MRSRLWCMSDKSLMYRSRVDSRSTLTKMDKQCLDTHWSVLFTHAVHILCWASKLSLVSTWGLVYVLSPTASGGCLPSWQEYKIVYGLGHRKKILNFSFGSQLEMVQNPRVYKVVMVVAVYSDEIMLHGIVCTIHIYSSLCSHVFHNLFTWLLNQKKSVLVLEYDAFKTVYFQNIFLHI